MDKETKLSCHTGEGTPGSRRRHIGRAAQSLAGEAFAFPSILCLINGQKKGLHFPGLYSDTFHQRYHLRVHIRQIVLSYYVRTNCSLQVWFSAPLCQFYAAAILLSPDELHQTKASMTAWRCRVFFFQRMEDKAPRPCCINSGAPTYSLDEKQSQTLHFEARSFLWRGTERRGHRICAVVVL